jgi:hypothetical protein
MPIDRCDPDRDVEHLFAPRARAALLHAASDSRSHAMANHVENVVVFCTLGSLLCAAFLILSQGWSL